MPSVDYWLSHPRIQLCKHALAAGDVIAYPTEAVWGLGCDPFNRHGVANILKIKKRPVHKGLIMVAASLEQIDYLVEGLPASQREQLESSWPGPQTWLLPHRGRVPPWVSGDSTSVAVRVSAHTLVQALCLAYGGPIVSTSANVQGRPPAKTALDVRKYFRHFPVVCSPGRVGKRDRPSQIRDLLSGQVIRA